MAGCSDWYPAATAATTATGQAPQGIERGDRVATGGDTGPEDRVCRQLSPTCRHPESKAGRGLSPESPLSPRLTPPRGESPSKLRIPGGNSQFQRASRRNTLTPIGQPGSQL